MEIELIWVSNTTVSIKGFALRSVLLLHLEEGTKKNFAFF